MKIEIKYESSWRNSFLEGSNNEPLPKEGRKFIGSMKSLNEREGGNYITRAVSHNTIMGILNRLIGDQRKLYQARQQEHYYFENIEPLVTFADKPSYINQEMTYIRNISGNEDRDSYTGMIKVDDPIFCSDYSEQLWGILKLDIDELCDFILDEKLVIKTIAHNPLVIIGQLEDIFKLKPVPNENRVGEAFNYLKNLTVLIETRKFY